MTGDRPLTLVASLKDNNSAKLLSSHHNNNRITSSPLPPSGPCSRTNITAHGTVKRKLEVEDSLFIEHSRPKRISPFLNTPKQRREERRKVLRISVQKLRQIDDAEVFLRRSVLINNTMKKLQQEVREEKMARFGYQRLKDEEFNHFCNPKKKTSYDNMLTPSYLSCNQHLFDDVPAQFNNNDKITDDMTDTLVKCVRGLDDENSPSESAADSSSKSESPLESSTQSSTCCENNNNKAMDTTSSETLKECSSDLCMSDECSNITERDRQILGEMDIVFNNLIRVLSESG